MASAKSIVEAAKSIPMMKENLRKAFDDLQSHSSSLASFTLQWKDIDGHFSGIEKSIEVRLKELESKVLSMPEKSSPVAAAEKISDKSEATPRPELKSLCLKSDWKGILPFLSKNRKKDLAEIKKEIIPALRLAPDPAKLVLEVVEGFYSPKPEGGSQNDGDFMTNKKSCNLLLECLHVISPEIKPPIKKKAKKLAVQWKGKISDSGEGSVAHVFLQLLVSFDLASEIDPDEIMDAIVFVSSRMHAVDFCRNLGLGYKVPDLIGKLKNSKGKQLNAVKFVYAFDLVDKFPPVTLLKAYINESKKITQGLRKMGNYARRAQYNANAKEIAALRNVIKVIEEYKLESEYSLKDLSNQIAELRQERAHQKRNVKSTAAPSSKSQEQPSKRPRPSSTTTTPAAVATPATTSSVVMAYPTGQYLSSALPYGMSGGGSLYNHVPPSLVGNPLAMGANQRPTLPYAYPPDPLMASGLYARPMSYGSYPPLGGLPSSQFNPSLYH